MGASLESFDSIEALLRAAADSVARLLPCDRVALIEFDRTRRAVGFFAGGGPGQHQVVTTVSYDELQQGLSGWVMTHGKPALSPKDTPDPRETPEVRRRRRETNCGSILVVPLRMAGQVCGTMTAINTVDQPDFTPEDTVVTEFFANYCAVVIQNARHYLQLKKTNDEIEALNAVLHQRHVMKDNLLTILAHDLRGPVGNTALILDEILGEHGLSDDLSQLAHLGSQAAHQTYDLLENLLTWVRSQVDGTPAALHPVVVRDVLEDVRSWLQAQASRKRLRFAVHCPEFLTVVADLGALGTIVRNLGSNAVKYSSPEGEVVLSAREVPGGVCLEVQDFGVGMTPGVVQKVFSGKKVASHPGTSGEMGSGLGLMFCRDLTQTLGGNLDVETAPGQGTTVRLTLPAP